MQTHGFPLSVPNTSCPAWPCTARARAALVELAHTNVSAVLQAERTCAAGEVGNVAVLEDLLVLEHLGQPPETRAAHDSHSRPHWCAGQQPVGRGPALLVADAVGVRKTNKSVSVLLHTTQDKCGGGGCSISSSPMLRCSCCIFKMLRFFSACTVMQESTPRKWKRLI